MSILPCGAPNSIEAALVQLVFQCKSFVCRGQQNHERMRMAKRKQNSDKARLNEIPTAGGGITRAAYARATQARLDVALLLKHAGLTASQVTNFSSRIGVRN